MGKNLEIECFKHQVLTWRLTILELKFELDVKDVTMMLLGRSDLGLKTLLFLSLVLLLCYQAYLIHSFIVLRFVISCVKYYFVSTSNKKLLGSTLDVAIVVYTCVECCRFISKGTTMSITFMEGIYGGCKWLCKWIQLLLKEL